MKRNLPKKIHEALKHLEDGVRMLRQADAETAPKLQFTLDGRLIGDIGELLAAGHLDIAPQKCQQTGFDGTDQDGRHVEIKTTRLKSIAFRKIAERVICIKIHGNSHWEVIFDGPGTQIADQFLERDFKEGESQVKRGKPASLRSQRQLSIKKLASLPLITAH